MQTKNQMKTCWKIFAIIFILVLTLAGIVFVYPESASTTLYSFDANNGRMKTEYVTFGRTYRVFIEDTRYSKLLKGLSFEDLPPEWKLASAEEHGIRGWLFPQQMSYTYGKIAAKADYFAMMTSLDEYDSTKVPEQARRLQGLIQNGNRKAVDEYVAGLQRNIPK